MHRSTCITESAFTFVAWGNITPNLCKKKSKMMDRSSEVYPPGFAVSFLRFQNRGWIVEPKRKYSEKGRLLPACELGNQGQQCTGSMHEGRDCPWPSFDHTSSTGTHRSSAPKDQKNIVSLSDHIQLPFKQLHNKKKHLHHCFKGRLH